MQKVPVLSALCVLCALAVLPASAAPGDFAGYITYTPPVQVRSFAVPGDELVWLGDIAALLAQGDATLLRRQDSDRWASLTHRAGDWLLQIRDDGSDFNFRASVDPATGKMSVIHGVDREGTDRVSDATRAARIAVEYIRKMRVEQGVFSEKKLAATESGSANAWKRLLEGNARFASGKSIHPAQDRARLAEIAKAQHPFAVVVSCSDSRVPPEILFDQGMGDLFVVRTAGEVVGELEMGSIEYAVEHLGAGYILVLGHTRCGAVDATIKGGVMPPAIAAIADMIRPAIDKARPAGGDLLDNTVRENARLILASIAKSPAIAEAMEKGDLALKAGYYDLDSGEVTGLK